MRFLAPAAAAIALLSAPAFAQDEDFSGARVDLVAAYDELNVKTEEYAKAGPVFGASAGYDIQSGAIVLGVEGEFTFGTHEFDGLDVSTDLYAGARLGVVVTPSTLLYAKAGYTSARLSDSEVVAKLAGYRVGAGVERKLGNGFYGKVEYRYSDYDTKYNFGAPIERHQVALGLGLRF